VVNFAQTVARSYETIIISMHGNGWSAIARCVSGQMAAPL
jgi:hypothetical protein